MSQSRNFIDHQIRLNTHEDYLSLYNGTTPTKDVYYNCKIYVKGDSPSGSIIYVPENTAFFIDCVVHYSTTVVVQKVQRIYKKTTQWYIQTPEGKEIKLIDLTNQQYVANFILADNFICQELFNPVDFPGVDNFFNFDASFLRQCSVESLSNLTSSGKAKLVDFDYCTTSSIDSGVELFSDVLDRTKNYVIKLTDTTIRKKAPKIIIKNMNCQSIFIDDLDYLEAHKQTGTEPEYKREQNLVRQVMAQLVIDGVQQTSANDWNIQAPNIRVDQLQYDFIIMQQQTTPSIKFQGEDDTTAVFDTYLMQIESGSGKIAFNVFSEYGYNVGPQMHFNQIYNIANNKLDGTLSPAYATMNKVIPQAKTYISGWTQ